MLYFHYRKKEQVIFVWNVIDFDLVYVFVWFWQNLKVRRRWQAFCCDKISNFYHKTIQHLLSNYTCKFSYRYINFNTNKKYIEVLLLKTYLTKKKNQHFTNGKYIF